MIELKYPYPRKSGIYCFKNIKNNKKYIGKSNNIARRLTNHIRNLRENKNKSKGLQEAWNNFGEKNFKIYLIELCEVSILEEREIFYIKKYKTNTDKYGYNRTIGGNGSSEYELRKPMKGENHPNYGKPMSKEQRDKISRTRIERQIGVGENSPNYGKKLTKEQKDKISENHADVSGNKNPRFGKKPKNPTSKYYGVSYIKRRDSWKVTITINKIQILIGSNKSEVKAAQMWDDYIINNNLPNPLNFPDLNKR